MNIRGLGIKSWQLLFLARMIDREETWKYTNEVDGVRWSWMYE
jgi:hypothetical protein